MWTRPPDQTLPFGRLHSQTINLDGWSLSEFATRIYDLVAVEASQHLTD